MIPKIIHYCWFGCKSKPQEVLDYIETWKHFLPDYEIKEWNESNFNFRKMKFTREAYSMKKYAFVSDVARLYALYEYGGIYFDTDIEVRSSFDSFLLHKSFIGYEVENFVGTGVIGAEKESYWIKSFIERYKTSAFINLDGSFNELPNTIVATELIKKLPKNARPEIYPVDFFCAKNWKTKEITVTPNTVSIHHYRATWLNGDNITMAGIIDMKISKVFHIKNHYIFNRLYKFYLKLTWL